MYCDLVALQVPVHRREVEAGAVAGPEEVEEDVVVGEVAPPRSRRARGRAAAARARSGASAARAGRSSRRARRCRRSARACRGCFSAMVATVVTTFGALPGRALAASRHSIRWAATLARMPDAARDLLAFIDASPTPYHAVAETMRRLEAAGFARLARRRVDARAGRAALRRARRRRLDRVRGRAASRRSKAASASSARTRTRRTCG